MKTPKVEYHVQPNCLYIITETNNGNMLTDNLPYGIYLGQWRHFAGGIGTNCYYKISEAIGGKFEHLASGKTFDGYKYTDNEGSN